MADINESAKKTFPEARYGEQKIKSISPLRNKSGGRSVPEQALPSYHIRDELRSSGQKRPNPSMLTSLQPLSPNRSGSPLRTKPQPFQPKDLNQEFYPPNNESYNRVRISVERISKVLGLSNPLGSSEMDARPRNLSNPGANPSANVPHETPGINRQVDLRNMIDRSISRSPERQSSPYNVLRQKSPQRYNASFEQEAPTATKFASVS